VTPSILDKKSSAVYGKEVAPVIWTKVSLVAGASAKDSFASSVSSASDALYGRVVSNVSRSLAMLRCASSAVALFANIHSAAPFLFLRATVD
jgi:hypothetical protein